jgi:hypothetical protein
MLDTQTFDNFLTENFLSKIFGAIKYLCLELVLTLHFLLNLLLSPSSCTYLATGILDNLVPREVYSAVIRGLPYRCFESK